MAALEPMPNKNEGFEARPYQLELVDYVMERNAIIYLPTGAGKTFVAILALKRFSHTVGKTIAEGGKRAVFMCNTVELARQQYKAIKKNTNLVTGFYIGERDVDNWKRTKWQEEIDENQVLVGTAQIFVNCIAQNYIKISDFSLVIIDECHNASGKHPMREFLKLFEYDKKQNELPRVIGLTGVLLQGNKTGDIRKELSALEAAFRGKIVTVRTMEQYNNVMLYSTKPTELLIPYATKGPSTPIEESIRTYITTKVIAVINEWNLGALPVKLTRSLGSIAQPSKKKFIQNLLSDFLYQMDDLGIYAAAIAIMSPIIEFEVKKRQAETLALRSLYRYTIGACEFIRHKLVSYMNEQFADDDDDGHDGDEAMAVASTSNNNGVKKEPNLQQEMLKILTFATPKLAALLKYLLDTFKNKQPLDFNALIFVQRRYTAKCLYYVVMKWIEYNPMLQSVLKPEFMVGRNTVIASIESLLESKWTINAIEKFRTGECNLIICSSVLEEGIDIQACNYVLAFDPLKTFTSYIQTKGRARSSSSQYVIFTSRETQNTVTAQIVKYQQVHAIIREYLMGRILDGPDPTEDETKEQFQEKIKPFTTTTGALLLASNALPLLYRYCARLPTDSFGIVVPWFQLRTLVNAKREVLLKLPLQSPLRETIKSDPMPNPRLAKISAAFNTCKELYRIGELNERLLPVTKKECLAKTTAVFFEHWEKYNDDVTTNNKKQTRRIYEKACPPELCNAIPKVGETFYAYEIQIVPFFETNEYNEHILEALLQPNCYAILLKHRLPALAEMPLFMNQGSLKAVIAETPIVGRIASEEQLQKLARFHITIFRDVLQCWKSYCVLDHRNEINSYLIVPIQQHQGIDWSLVERFQQMPPMRTYSVAERQQAIYRPEDYVGKVVGKWYAGESNDFFVVTKVLEHMSTLSSFDDASYTSYKQFSEQRYGREIVRVVQPDQFLLEVRQITKRRNFFINATGKSKIIMKQQRLTRLIPELCHNYQFPAHMWILASFLPSILHRFQFMLHAEALRRSFNDFLGIHNSSDYRPKPLIVDCSLRRAVDSDGNAVEEMEKVVNLLPALPAKCTVAETCPKQKIMQQQSWKDYMEPADMSRKPLHIFPIDVSYYSSFISGLVPGMEALDLNADQYTNEQFNVPQPQGRPMQTTQLQPIADVPLEQKRELNLLQRSLQNSNDSNIASAEQYEFVAALTTASANDVFDMERLELLGDSFLKLAASLYLANRYPNWHEGFLSEIKSRIVSNRNLLYCMLDLDMAKLICAGIFQPLNDWLPPLATLPLNLLQLLQQHEQSISNITPADLYALDISDDEVLTGRCAESKLMDIASRCCQPETAVQNEALIDYDSQMYPLVHKMVLQDKVVADTLEALMGVSVKYYGIHRSFALLDFFGICKAEEGSSLRNLLELNLKSSLLRTNITKAEVDGFLINYEKLQQNLGYQFKDRAYLLQALTHPSYPTNRLTGCYQELEFIGDAILDFLISAYLYERFENMTPGMLTDMRSALVNNVTLGCICVRHRFHLFILSENSKLSESIKTFDDFQATQNYRVTEQVRILQEESDVSGTYNIATSVDVPKTLGDVVEALIAAVFLDSRDLTTTWHVIFRLFQQELHEFSVKVPMDPVRELLEHKSANAKFDDAVVNEDVVLVTCWFNCLDKQVEVNGFGNSARTAKKSAAKQALQYLTVCS